MQEDRRPTAPAEDGPSPNLNRDDLDDVILAARQQHCAHQVLECLTAIRNYAAGAYHLTRDGHHGRTGEALRAIEQQVNRAHDIIAAVRNPPDTE